MTPNAPIRQWTLDSQQIVNWGCFGGYWRVTFADTGRVTMFSGRTGSGKSTFLDANTVLMQPSRTRLNRASNASTTGHARNETERNVVSYMRGMLDKSRDGADEVNKVLREGTVWSAIAQTWRNADGTVLTAFVVYFARPDDQTTPSVKRFGRVDGEFDLQCLERFTQGEHLARPLLPSAIKREHPGVTFEDNLPALHRTLWHRLGIGVNGDGGRAMELLHRVQSSDGIGSVNELFTRLVLDEPSTFDKAADAVAHFARLDEAHAKVQLIEDQVKILKDIPDWWGTYRSSLEEGRFYEFLAATSDREAVTPFWKWARTREYDLLAVRERQNSDERKAAALAETAAGEAVTEIGRLLTANETKRQASGGARVDQIDTEIRHVSEARGRAETARSQIGALCGDHFAVPATGEAHSRQTTFSRTFETSYGEYHRAATETWKEAVRAKYPLLARRSDLVREQSYLTGRVDLIPEVFSKIRQRYSDLTGIPVADLPYVAELVDMSPEWQDWRPAAELTLGGFAFQLLVPADRVARFRELTDLERTSRRVNSLTVPAEVRPVCTRDQQTLAGRLVFSDHPYAGWLSNQVRDRFDHLCVPDGRALGELPTGSRGVTRAGQVSDGRRGSHGGQKGHQPIIGFSPQARLDDIARELKDLDDELHLMSGAENRSEGALKSLEAEHAAHEVFLRTSWSDLDVGAQVKRLGQLNKQRLEALADTTLKALEEEREELVKESEKRRDELWEQRNRVTTAKKDHDALVGRSDSAWRHLVRLEHVEEPHMDRMDALLSKHLEGRPVSADDFEQRTIGPFVKVINSEASAVASDGKAARDKLVSAFTAYLRDYPDPSLTVDPDLSYEEFKAILDRHEESGVEKAKENFADYTATFAGLEVMHLNTAYQNEMEMIFKRLEQVNSILRDQPYGADGRGRISIAVRPGGMPDEAVIFLRRLSEITSHSTHDLSYEEALARFTSFKEVIGQLKDQRTAVPLLDVRRHLRLEAQHRDESGELIAIHDTLAGKSGGESQELTMFIIAAAIRDQVGSLEDEKPRFAPVFLDEGMVKADPETTQRAASVWKRLGFQPIIAVPLDKHESVMVEADLCWSVSKDAEGRSRLDWMKPQVHSEDAR